MCTGIEIGLLASAVIGTTASIYQADTQAKAADANAEMARREGNQQKDAAMAQAEKIRKAGRAATAQANASMAAAGVAIGEGTPLRINEQINMDVEDDAYSTLLTGTRRQRSAEDEGMLMRYQGDSAKTAGYVNAGATLLSSGADYGKWKAKGIK
jgi:hypothetical protein